MGHVLERVRVRGASMEISPKINACTLARGSSQIGDRAVSCKWLVPEARGTECGTPKAV